MTESNPKSRILLFISTYGFDCRWVTEANHKILCTPIEVGAARRTEDEILYPLRDNTGDNISADNAYWGELSGLYWLYKNYEFHDGDIIGFCHYNKYLNVDGAEVISFLSRHEDGWVSRVPIKLIRHTFPEEITALKDILEEYYPEYYMSWNAAYDEGGGSVSVNCYAAELFYTTPREFRHYAEFIFGVLFRLRERIGDVDRPPFYTRYCAFLGERLLTVYFMTHHNPVLEVHQRSPDQTILGKIADRLHLDKSNEIYILLRKLVRGSHYRGSYAGKDER